MAYCGHCGAQLVDGDEFCEACGTPVRHASLTPPPLAEPAERRTGRIALIAAAIIVLLGVLIAGFIGWSRAGQPSPAASTSTAGSSTSTTQAAGGGSSTTATSTPPVVVAPTTPKTPPAKTNLTANDVTHQATWVVKSGSSGGKKTLALDYVLFLTGSAAAKAAKAHGETVENDYYVVNDNTKLRTFPVSSAVVIVLHPGSGPQFSREFTFDEFTALMSTHEATYSGLIFDWNKQQTYWVNVKNGKIVRLENQWVP